MTVHNTKDDPTGLCTDDTTVVMNNFVKYYGELHSHKPINKTTLNKLIDKLDIDLTPEEAVGLDKTILPGSLVATPNCKTPGTDSLPYEAYKADHKGAATILARLANRVADTATLPASWRDIAVAVLAKEQDSNSTHKYRPIALLNTDYKIIMRLWANRMGNLIVQKIGHHQRGFIPGRDGRENVLNVQLIMDLINADIEGEGAMIFLDQEKAFDMVSFNAIKTTFIRKGWPGRFNNLLAAIYRTDTTRSKVRVNGKLSEN